MIRIIITQIVLFALPFVAFFVYQAVTQGFAAAAVSGTGRTTFTLILLGGLLVIAGFIYFAVSGSQSEGVYVPAHLENGTLVPGGFRSR